jgi:hypothetical protein
MVDKNAVALGRKGGANSRKNQPDGGTALGRRAVKVRWDAYYAAHPEKLKAKLEREKNKAVRTGKKKAAK